MKIRKLAAIFLMAIFALSLAYGCTKGADKDARTLALGFDAEFPALRVHG